MEGKKEREGKEHKNKVHVTLTSSSDSILKSHTGVVELPPPLPSSLRHGSTNTSEGSGKLWDSPACNIVVSSPPEVLLGTEVGMACCRAIALRLWALRDLWSFLEVFFFVSFGGPAFVFVVVSEREEVAEEEEEKGDSLVSDVDMLVDEEL